MSSITCKVKAMVLSDIHLFHNKTPTEFIVDNLIRVLPDNEKMREYDILFISGDLFDRSVSLPNKDVGIAYQFVNHLLNICHKYDIILRVLEGTPSHDWGQSKMIVEMNNMRTNKVDVKHVKTLSIEHIEKFNLDVLYVPDEWGSGCKSTFEEVKALLIEHNLDKVDLSIMHGCFNYQFPVNLVGKPDVHDEESYLGITRYVIVIGHYHVHSNFKRIYVPGSFDRLKHGEENPKGYLDVYLYPDGNYKVNFIENKRAMQFITYNVTNLPMTDVFTLMEAKLPKDKECHIRLTANKEDVVTTNLSELKSKYPLIHFSIQTNKVVKEKLVSKTEDIVKPLTLSQLNLIELMQERLVKKDPARLSPALELLKGIINANEEHDKSLAQKKQG